MNEMTPLNPDIVELATIGNRVALLLPEGFGLPDTQQWAIVRVGDELRLVPFVEGDWRWAQGLAGVMDDDWAQAIAAGRIGPDHPDNALDDEPVFS